MKEETIRCMFMNWENENIFYKNLPSNLFPDENNFLFNSPFYAGLTLKFSRLSRKMYFSLSFNAYLVNGISLNGNGSFYSSTGLLNENFANPNIQYKGLGRYSNDRGYIGKLLFSYKILNDLTSILQIRYKDGEPFGSWRTYIDSDSNQVAFYRINVNGDNLLLYDGEFGKREDNTWDITITLNYYWKIFHLRGKAFFTIYNILDLGGAIAEYTLYDDLAKGRASLESQTPRGIYLGIESQW